MYKTSPNSPLMALRSFQSNNTANMSAYDAALEAQRSLVEDLSTSMIKEMSTIPFACGGSIDNINNVQIRFGPQGSGSIVSLPIKSTEMSVLHALLAASKPASFGRGNEEVVDETYRKATKLDTTDFLTDFCPYKAGIIDIISQMLLPALQSGINSKRFERRGVEAQLYKLNVYSGPGGMQEANNAYNCQC